MALQADPLHWRELAHSPERRLCAAIIKQSVDDLTHHDARIRGEARAFWTARFGPMAAHRRDLLLTLDIDDGIARKRIAHLLEDDAVRERQLAEYRARPIYLDLLDAIPDGEFSTAEIMQLDHGLTPINVTGAMNMLKSKDLIRFASKRGRNTYLWARTDWLIEEAFKAA